MEKEGKQIEFRAMNKALVGASNRIWSQTISRGTYEE